MKCAKQNKSIVCIKPNPQYSDNYHNVLNDGEDYYRRILKRKIPVPHKIVIRYDSFQNDYYNIDCIDSNFWSSDFCIASHTFKPGCCSDNKDIDYYRDVDCCLVNIRNTGYGMYMEITRKINLDTCRKDIYDFLD